MAKPFRIMIGGSELENYTSATLKRAKNQLTGELSVTIFYGRMPNSPIEVNALRGQEILCYVHGHLAFNGRIDKRGGRPTQGRDEKGRFTGETVTASEVAGKLTQQGYTVTISARGKTKYLIDSSHRIPTNAKNATDREVIQNLLRGHDIELDWQAEEIKQEIIRIRDGSVIKDEIFRLCDENCHYAYETRDGKLRITDQAIGRGQDLILGVNILDFNAEQSEDLANSEVTVKGHRNDDSWGEEAVIPTVKTIKDSWVGSNIPLVIQHYGNAKPEALERRAKFEVDKRASQSKKVTLELFGVGEDGAPWDIGALHYVEIPVEGVFDVMECVELTYSVDSTSMTTSMSLAPPPSKPFGASGQSLTSSPSPSGDSMGAVRRAELGIQIIPGEYPSSWTGAEISDILNPAIILSSVANSLVKAPEEQPSSPPMTIQD